MDLHGLFKAVLILYIIRGEYQLPQSQSSTDTIQSLPHSPSLYRWQQLLSILQFYEKMYKEKKYILFLYIRKFIYIHICVGCSKSIPNSKERNITYILVFFMTFNCCFDIYLKYNL